MKNAAAWVSLISGILAFIFSPFGPILSLIAIVGGVMGRKKKNYQGIATIGLILGIVWWIVLIILTLTGALGRILGWIGF